MVISGINLNVFQPRRHVFWNEAGSLVCLATEDSYFILQVDISMIQNALATKQQVSEDGIEEAFEVSSSA